MAVRRTPVPLHDEVLRLGFLEYVRAVEAEKTIALFPELFLNSARIGGHQFRNIAWRYMMDWIGSRMPIPENEFTGKGADMHSIRALGSSFYGWTPAIASLRAGPGVQLLTDSSSNHTITALTG